MIKPKPTLRILLLLALLNCPVQRAALPSLVNKISHQSLQTLEPGRPVERDILPGETHAYEVTVEADKYIQFYSEHPGLRAEMKLLDSAGKLLSSLDNIAFDGWLRVQGIAANAGLYRVEIRAFRNQPAGTMGRYKLTWTHNRAPTDRERLRHEIEEQTLATLAHMRNGQYAAAIAGLERELLLQRQLVPDEPADLVHRLNRLASIATRLGDFARAESALNESIHLAEQRLGPQAELLANALVTLAHLYTVYGLNHEVTNGHLQRALSIHEKLFGAEHPIVANTLTSLGNLHFGSKDYDQAETLYQRALEIYEKQTPDNQTLATPLYSLGKIAHLRGQYDKAETLLRRAQGLQERTFGSEHPTTALTIFERGKLAQDQGQLTEAVGFYQGAYEIFSRSRGADHVLTIEALDALGQLKLAQDDVSAALPLQKQALSAAQRNLRALLAIGSEPQRRSFLALYQHQTDTLLSLPVRLALDDQRVQELAATTLLQRKGLIQETFANTLANLRSRVDPEAQGALERWHGVSERLARLVLDGPAPRRSAAEHQQQVDALTQQRDQLESELSRRSAGSFQPARAVTLSEIQQAIPSNAALLEFAVYRPFNPKAPTYGERYSAPRYGVFAIRANGAVVWRELGEAETLEAAIAGWRAALRDSKRTDTARLGRSVSARLLEPLLPLLTGVEHLLISPDGALNLIPFEALPEAPGRYLIERFAISYLTSGRDLLRMQQGEPSGAPSGEIAGAPVVMADPFFGEPGASSSPALASRTSAHPRRRSTVTGTNLSELYFAPLFGTAKEAHVIKTLFEEASVLTGTLATEAALKHVSGPRVLHIATHGFFLEDANAISGKPTVGVNPLLRSGLALARANLRKENAEGEDGILTALEAAGLNLSGTRLLTLSACDTGLGEVRNGEGVYGLRRAFALAGAETLMMSLWPVSDLVTRELMTAYYTSLQQGNGRGAALRAVQLQLLKRPDRRAPYYWAAFIQIGDWRDLNGRR